MKVIILNKGKQINVIDVDIETIISEAERSKIPDPIKATVAEIESIIIFKKILKAEWVNKSSIEWPPN